VNAPITPPSLAAQIANLPKLAMKDLWTVWDKYFPQRPPHHNRAYVEGRVAYKIQEEALGTALLVQTQMARIGEAQSNIKTQRGAQRLLLNLVGDAAFDIGPVMVGWSLREVLVPNRPQIFHGQFGQIGDLRGQRGWCYWCVHLKTPSVEGFV